MHVVVILVVISSRERSRAHQRCKVFSIIVKSIEFRERVSGSFKDEVHKLTRPVQCKMQYLANAHYYQRRRRGGRVEYHP